MLLGWVLAAEVARDKQLLVDEGHCTQNLAGQRWMQQQQQQQLAAIAYCHTAAALLLSSGLDGCVKF